MSIADSISGTYFDPLSYIRPPAIRRSSAHSSICFFIESFLYWKWNVEGMQNLEFERAAVKKTMCFRANTKIENFFVAHTLSTYLSISLSLYLSLSFSLPLCFPLSFFLFLFERETEGRVVRFDRAFRYFIKIDPVTLSHRQQYFPVGREQNSSG